MGSRFLIRVINSLESFLEWLSIESGGGVNHSSCICLQGALPSLLLCNHTLCLAHASVHSKLVLLQVNFVDALEDRLRLLLILSQGLCQVLRYSLLIDDLIERIAFEFLDLGFLPLTKVG